MLWLGFVIGILLGFAFGFLAAVYCAVHNDEEAVDQGVIKLCGRFFRLEEIQQ